MEVFSRGWLNIDAIRIGRPDTFSRYRASCACLLVGTSSQRDENTACYRAIGHQTENVQFGVKLRVPGRREKIPVFRLRAREGEVVTSFLVA